MSTDTETLEARLLRLLKEAGIDPIHIPEDGPITTDGYTTVREPLQVVGNNIVTDWHTWDEGTDPALITQIAGVFDDYQRQRNRLSPVDARQLLLDAFAELGDGHSYGFDLEEIPNTLRKWGIQEDA